MYFLVYGLNYVCAAHAHVCVRPHTHSDYIMAYCFVRPHQKNNEKKTKPTEDDEENARIHVSCARVCVFIDRKVISAQHHLEFNTYIKMDTAMQRQCGQIQCKTE